MPLKIDEYDLLREIAVSIGKTETKIDNIEKRMDTFSIQKIDCNKRFTALEAHRNKVLGAITVTLFLSSLAAGKSFGMF